MAKARILAVDDQRYFRELLAGMLAEEGFEAQTASSGEEALHILENSDFDIVLTDLVMPGMDGSELVHRVKERDPEQAVVVVTGVVDVRTAVDAMKLGATDYLLKPFDRRTLSLSLEGILQNRRLQADHARLLEENIEYIGERTLYERALGIFSTLSIEPLAVRIVEALCLETRAQGGVLWVAGEGDSEELDLAAARGLVRLADEPETIALSELPEELLEGGERTTLEAWGDGYSQTAALYAALRREGRIVALVRLTDKLEGEQFDVVDRACVEKFMDFAEVAIANAKRVQRLERRSLQDPGTGVYSFDYFQDIVRNEIEKANRFGRSLALFKLDLGSLAELRRVGGEGELSSWLARIAELLRCLLRATDLLAVDSDHRFYALLAEVDALGAAVLKRRALQALESSELVARLVPHVQPRAGVAVYPGDGTQLESLLRALDARIREGEHSKVAALGLDQLSLAAGLQALVRLGSPERLETAEQLARFVLDEVARHPQKRGLLYVAPGVALKGVVRRGLELLRDVSTQTDVVVIGDGERPAFPAGDVSWISSQRIPGLPPCLIHYRDGPAYALVREEGRNGAPGRLFHTSDRSLVEHLTFRLREELAVPLLLEHEGSG
jgi:diguanylate cyclase (GGDEF)-like protein